VAHAGVRKESSGYGMAPFVRSGDLIDLLVGSEGTLALFVGVELRLAPAPLATSTVFATFDSLERAVDASRRAREGRASACEMLDRTFLEVAGTESPVPIPMGSEIALLVEMEADDALRANSAALAMRRAMTAAGATSVILGVEPEVERRLWSLRHAASPALARVSPELKSMQIVEDGAVPPAALPDYVRGVRTILERHATRGVIFGHAGDGNVHVNPLIDVGKPGWRQRVDAIIEETTALVAALGGTLSGEHGDGRLRAPLLPRVWSKAAMARFASLKLALDPEGVFNPGVKIAADGQSVADIKYDPALPPLPPRARQALDRLERERCYATSRLALLDDAMPEGGASTR